MRRWLALGQKAHGGMGVIGRIKELVLAHGESRL